MKNYKAKTVDAYIASAEAMARLKLKELRKLVRSAVPKAEESISWGVPFYKYYGVLVGFAASKNHVSFGLVTVLGDADRAVLAKKGYITGKKTIQIRYDQKTPSAIIRRILKAKAKVNEAKKKEKK